MGRPIVSSVTLVAAAATNIALSQSIPGTGQGPYPFTLNGAAASKGVATLDAPRRVIITSGGNDTGITFTITGTARSQQNSAVQSETITGASGGAASTTQDFATVTGITASGATASTVTAGTNGTGSGPWVPWNQNANLAFQVSLYGVILSGSPTWEVEYTYDDVFGLWLPSNVPFPRALALQGMSGITAASADGEIAFPVRASRLTLTAVGSVQLTQTQQGI